MASHSARNNIDCQYQVVRKVQQRMSSKEEVDSTAQRLLNRCEQIEESNKKIEQSLVESANEDTDDMSSSEYRQQLDEIRRVLFTSQENAKLKQNKLEEEISLLKNELNALKEERESKIRAEEELIKERDELKVNLTNAMSWAEKAHEHVVKVNEENTKYKKIVFALGCEGGGNLRTASSRILMGNSGRNIAGSSGRNLGGNSSRNLGGKSTRSLFGGNSTRNMMANSSRNLPAKNMIGTIEEDKETGSPAPLRGLNRSLNESTRAGESPMEKNTRRAADGTEKSTRSILRDWGTSLMSKRNLTEPSTDERNTNNAFGNGNIALAIDEEFDEE